MQVTGKIKLIGETKTFGTGNFAKRDLVVTTEEQYPQMILIEFVQDKTDLLNNFKIDDNVKVSINLRGREWINPEGVAKYFNAIQGWRIEKESAEEASSNKEPLAETFGSKSITNEEPSDLPF